MRHMLGGFGRLALVIVLAVGLVVFIVFVTGWGQRLTASFRGETGAIERTEANASFRIGTYESFFALCEAVQNAEAQAAALETELETDPPQARTTQIHASLTAVRSNRASSINEYNSAARQEHREAFRDANLPERLDTDTTTTECTT